MPATKRLTDIPLPLSRLRQCASRARLPLWRGLSRLPCNCPHEAGEFPCDRGAHNRRLLPSGAQHAIAGRQAGLRFPGDLANR